MNDVRVKTKTVPWDDEKHTGRDSGSEKYYSWVELCVWIASVDLNYVYELLGSRAIVSKRRLDIRLDDGDKLQWCLLLCY